MADNVMALVKKKGAQQKLRGKRAQAAKKRAAVAAAKPKRVPDKRNPFRPFTYMDPNEMIEEIDNFVANAGWTEERHVPDLNLDREMVKLFHTLSWPINDTSLPQYVLRYF